MKLIIEIPDEEYKQLHFSRKLEENLRIYVLNGKPYEEPKAEPEITEKQAIAKLINSGWLIKHDKELRDKWKKPKGKWKPKPVTFGTCFLQGFECECGRIVMQRENFCPDCGAQMAIGGEI